MAQQVASGALARPKPLSDDAIAAIRIQIMALLTEDPEFQARLREVVGPAREREVGAAEAGQIMELIEKQIGTLLDKRVERVVRSLIRPDYLLRPHLRPENVDLPKR